MITLAITSCGRADLLDETLTSFFKNVDTSLITEMLIHEDGSHSDCLYIADKHNIAAVNDFSSKCKGQMASVDILYSHVTNPYIFHCEDDWQFDERNPHILTQAVDVLQSEPDVHQVWVRHEKDHQHPIQPLQETTDNGVVFRKVTRNYQKGWCGFSLNPTLKRTTDVNEFFPMGHKIFKDEKECNDHVRTQGYKAVQLLHTNCKHIGWGRHVD